MPRSKACPLLCVAVLALAACARTSESPPIVTAPIASSTAAASPSAGPVASAPVPATSASAAPPGEPMGAADDTDGGSPQFRACQADSDCVAVPKVGCCHNGWMAAVNSSQKDAYAQSFTCPQPRPMCPMYIVRDTRVARCDAASHLCTMVRTQP